MNNNYKWNGVTFNSKGIIIEKVPVIPKANHSFVNYTIPGRSGFLVVDNKTYDPVAFSLECHFQENADINEIRAFLDGYGTLQVDADKEYTGYISNSINFDKVQNFQKFIIQFMLQPIAKSTTKTTVTAASTTTFTSDTYTDAHPVITLTCSGQVTIELNDVSFTLYNSNGTYVLDCEAKVITRNGINESGNMSGDFPYVKNGSNSLTVTGSVTALKIEYYKTYL